MNSENSLFNKELAPFLQLFFRFLSTF